MKDYLRNMLFNSDLDLSMSLIHTDVPGRFTVSSKIGAPRILLSLLFGIPCFVLLMHALRDQGIYLWLLPVFCPPLAILAVLFGAAKQQKTFIPSRGKALKSFQVFFIRRSVEIAIPGNGTVSVFKKWSSGGDSGGCYFFHAEVQGIEGLGFCIARNEHKRDDFAQELASFLGYTMRDLGERYE